MQVPPFLWKQIINAWPAKLVFARTNDSGGFVQSDVDFPACASGFPVNSYFIVDRINSRAQLGDGLAIDRNMAC
jgi:hypothetical protein